MPRCQTRSRQAFSLLELLVTLAVITILASLVIVSLQSIRERGLMAKSLGVIRQFQTANALYSMEHNGHYVPIRTRTEEGELVRWLNNKDYCEALGIPEGSYWPEEFISPKAGVLDSNGKPLPTRSYAMNKAELTDFDNVAVQWEVNIADVEDPANTIAFIDALDWIVGKYGLNRYTGEEVYTVGAVAYRYGGKATAVFYDGHTGAYTMEELINQQDAWWYFDKSLSD